MPAGLAFFPDMHSAGCPFPLILLLLQRHILASGTPNTKAYGQVKPKTEQLPSGRPDHYPHASHATSSTPSRHRRSAATLVMFDARPLADITTEALREAAAISLDWRSAFLAARGRHEDWATIGLRIYPQLADDQPLGHGSRVGLLRAGMRLQGIAAHPPRSLAAGALLVSLGTPDTPRGRESIAAVAGSLAD